MLCSFLFFFFLCFLREAFGGHPSRRDAAAKSHQGMMAGRARFVFSPSFAFHFFLFFPSPAPLSSLLLSYRQYTHTGKTQSHASKQSVRRINTGVSTNTNAHAPSLSCLFRLSSAPCSRDYGTQCFFVFVSRPSLIRLLSCSHSLSLSLCPHARASKHAQCTMHDACAL